MMRKCWVMLAALWLLMPVASEAAYDVKEVGLRHDVKAWMLEQHHLPLISVRVSVNFAGTAYDPKGKEGLAAVVSQLLSRGPADMEHQQFHQWMERRGIKLDIGADRERISIHLQSLTKFLPEALDMLGRILDQDSFSEEATKTVKAEMVAQLRRLKSQPWYEASQAFDEQVYGDHPYGNFSLGTEESVEAISPKDIARYMQSVYQPQHWTVAVVGDVTAETFKKHSALLFRRWADVVSKPGVVAHTPMHHLPEKPVQAKKEITSEKAIVMMAWPAPSRNSDEFMGAYLLNYMIGGGGLTSRLMLELRDARGLIYSGASDLDLWPSSNLWTIQYSTRPEQAKESIAATTELLKTIAEGKIDADIWERTKSEVAGSFALRTDSMSKLSNYLVVMQFFDLGKDYLDKRNDYIAQWSVQDAKALAEQWLKAAPHIVVHAGPKGEKKQ